MRKEVLTFPKLDGFVSVPKLVGRYSAENTVRWFFTGKKPDLFRGEIGRLENCRIIISSHD